MSQSEVKSFLSTIAPNRQEEAEILIEMMSKISNLSPKMWGPSIIGFGLKHYKYETGREGDIPQISFSPRKSAITIYFNEGFDRYADELSKLGKHKTSVACLYINKLDDINISVLKSMLEQSFKVNEEVIKDPKTVESYIKSIPLQARPLFDELRQIVKDALPNVDEVISYGIIGYKIDDKRARVFISGWKDHVAMYPLPKDEQLQAKLEPYIKGKGTLWFNLNEKLPKNLIKSTISALVKN